MDLAQVVFPGSWMDFPPSEAIDQDKWQDFINGIAGWVVLLFLIAFVLATVAYFAWARWRRVRITDDVFAIYFPMAAPLLSLLPGLFAGVLYVNDFSSLQSPVPPVTGAVTVGLWTALWGVLVSYITIVALPWLTPAKWRYRRLWPWLARRHSDPGAA